MASMGGLFVLLLIVGGIALYFLPAIIAGRRGHPNTVAIFFVNFFFGWSFIGWIAALIWACSGPATVPAPIAVSAPDEPYIGEQATKRCPACAEEILAVARKCKHCGETLAG